MIKKGTQGKNLNTIPYIRESVNSCGNRQWVIIDFLSTGSKKAD